MAKKAAEKITALVQEKGKDGKTLKYAASVWPGSSPSRV